LELSEVDVLMLDEEVIPEAHLFGESYFPEQSLVAVHRLGNIIEEVE
jgi:hypothetical protein